MVSLKNRVTNKKKISIFLGLLLIGLTLNFQNCLVKKDPVTGQLSQVEADLDHGNGRGYSGVIHEERLKNFLLKDADFYWLNSSTTCESEFGPSHVKGILEITSGKAFYYPGCRKDLAVRKAVSNNELFYSTDVAVLGYRGTRSNFQFFEAFPISGGVSETIEGTCYYLTKDDFRSFDNKQEALFNLRAVIYKSLSSNSRRAVVDQSIIKLDPAARSYLDGLDEDLSKLTFREVQDSVEVSYETNNQGDFLYDSLTSFPLMIEVFMSELNNELLADIHTQIHLQPVVEDWIEIGYDNNPEFDFLNPCFFSIQ